MSHEETLASVPIFSGLSRESLGQLAFDAFPRQYAAGEVIVKEGELGVRLYVVTLGSVEVVKGLHTDKSARLGILGPGEFFGEMALLDEHRRSASIRALENTECLGLDRWKFLAELRQQPSIAIELLRILAQRLRDSDARLTE